MYDRITGGHCQYGPRNGFDGGELASPAAVDALRKLQESKTKIVRDAASIALKKAEGKELSRRLH